MIAQIKENYLTSPTKFNDNAVQTRAQLLWLAAAIAMVQFIIRLGCMSNYGFHQDELLYMALGEHVNFGFKETPPFIALASVFSKTFIGDSVFAMRLIPAFCAALVIFFTGKITIKLGGQFFAVLLACTGIAFSSGFLATGTVFTPQIFDELCWILTAYLLISWFKSKENKYLILLGIVLGTGMLVKYTMALYAAGLFTGLLLFAETRIIFKERAFWVALLLAFLLFLPNLIWQVINGLPLIHHFNELRETQLIYNTPFDFLIQQLFVNGTGVILWFGGLLLLFLDRRMRKFRFLAVGYLFVIGILLILSGKSYYAFGAYPPLFACGGIFYELVIQKARAWRRKAFFTALLIPNLVLMIIVLPYLPIEKTAQVFEWTYTNLHIHFPLKWEDQKIHNMNQNYADMIGWDELAQKTSMLYNSLSPEEQQNTIIYADNYGEAGAIDYYKKDYNLPALISLRSSYSIWAPPNLTAQNMIYISNTLPEKPAGKVVKFAEVTNQFSRVKGMDIYLVRNIDPVFKAHYRKIWLQKRLGYTL